MARPTKLTADVQAKILEAILHGATYDLACKYAGIGYVTFRGWMIQGERDQADTPVRRLYTAVQAAEGQAATQWLALIDAAAVTDWHAAAWKLERRYPQLYGRTVQDVHQHVHEAEVEHAETVYQRLLKRLETLETAPNGREPA